VQVVVRIFLLGDQVSHLGAGDVNNSVLEGEHMIGIAVKALGLEEAVEVIAIAGVEENDRIAVARNVRVFCRDFGRGRYSGKN
jgi:hypothetical protein